jgi:UDP:flavonoid glycosyltransferase YjiC (YdhE family)
VSDPSHSIIDAAPGRRLRVLAVVELGSNWGHLLRLLPVVHALRSQGHEVLLAVPDVEQARKVFLGADVDIVACPSARRLGRQAPVSHYAELLDQCVFGDGPTLERALQHWAELLAQRLPDVVLTDFAPTALFVAHLHRLPLVQMAIGWEAPPANGPLPTVRPWEPVDLPRMQTLEARMLARLNRICARRDAPLLASMSALYATGVQLLATWPETDHFGPRTGATYIGPIYSADHGHPISWPDAAADAKARRVLIYLSPDPRNLMIIDSVRHSPVHAIAILPKIAKAAMARLASPRFQIRDQPVQLESVLQGADLVICNGGHGLTAASFLAGVPILALPRTVEQALVVQRLKEIGAARSMMDSGGPHRCAQLVHEMLSDGSARRAAQAIARKYAGSTQHRTILSVVEGVERAHRSTPARDSVDA